MSSDSFAIPSDFEIITFIAQHGGGYLRWWSVSEALGHGQEHHIWGRMDALRKAGILSCNLEQGWRVIHD